MQRNRTISIAAIALFAALALPVGMAAQQHHHYKLIDMGMFNSGPQSYAAGFNQAGPYQSVNDSGTFTGFADTSMTDPYSPNFCFDEAGPTGICYTAHAFQWQHGSWSDLGTLSGGASSAANWVSSNGLIAGASQNGETDPLLSGFPEVQAVLWINGHILPLGMLPEGSYESAARSVNSRGQVAGWALNTVPDAYSMAINSGFIDNYEPLYPYQSRAFLWENGAMKDLGTLTGGNDAMALGINEAGQVIGISYTNSTPNQVATECSYLTGSAGYMPSQDPFLWENGRMLDLGSLGGTCGYPTAMNNQGQVVGASDLPGDQVIHAFLWTKGKPMLDLQKGTGFDSAFGHAQMINDSGAVVGGAYLKGSTTIDAFLWDGKMHDLLNLNGCAYAFWINIQRQVVGNWGQNNCGQGAFLWENGGPMVDLNPLVSSNPTGLKVAGAGEINDRGEIAAAAVDSNSNLHAILLIPCDGNHPGVAGCDYSMVDASAVDATPATQGTPAGNAPDSITHSTRRRVRP